jgi:hypothetical protein
LGIHHSGGLALKTTPQLRGLAVNPALPRDCLDRLVTLAADEEMALRLAARDDLRPSHIETLLAGFGEYVIEPLLRFMDLSRVPRDDPGVVMLMIEQDDADPLWARELADSPDEEVRIGLALLRNLPADVIDKLAGDPNPEVASEIAGCQRLSREQMETLARHPDFHVRYALGRNSGYPADMLVKLAEEDEPPLWMKYAMTERTDLPQSIYDSLAADASKNVRYELARNPAIESSMLHGFATSPDQHMRYCAARNPAIKPMVLPRIANATEDELLSLVTTGSTQIRTLVAECEQLPASVLTALLKDPELSVVKSVIVKPEVTLEQLWDLVREHGLSVFIRAAHNPNCSAEMLIHFLKKGHTTVELYFEIARHRNTPPELLLDLVKHRDRRVIQAAAGNAALPVSSMRALLPR